MPPNRFKDAMYHHIRRLPVLLDVERPVKLKVGHVVVVYELGNGLVVAAGGETGGCSLGLDWQR
jgi:hypothetical protein